MIAHVLLHLLTSLGYRDKMKGFADSFNNSGVRILDCIYHRTPNYLKLHLRREIVNILPYTQCSYEGR